MAIIACSEHGFLVDHAQAIGRDVAPLNYECRGDLFELWTPYINAKTDSERPHKRQRKKQRTCDLNEGEVEGLKHHNQIRNIITTSTKHLVNLGKDARYFSEKQDSTLDGQGKKQSVVDYKCHIGSCTDAPINKPDSALNATKELQTYSHVAEHASCTPAIVLQKGGWYILPPETSYLMSDATQLQPLLDLAESKYRFDVLVMDPPWYNKSAKRSGKYSFMSLWQIKSLPVKQLLTNDALVAIWVTNKPKYIKFAKEELLSHWGLKFLAEWHWVKVTKTGEFVVDLDSTHKKPYETLIIGRNESQNCNEAVGGHQLHVHRKQVKNMEELPPKYHKDLTCDMIETQTHCNTITCIVHVHQNINNVEHSKDTADHQGAKSPIACQEANNTNDIKDILFDKCLAVAEDSVQPSNDNRGYHKPIPDHLVICSVPCQVHSRKPPLNDILADYVHSEAKCLEMFARNLTRGWTSWGNEVLKFQHIDYFNASQSCSQEL